MSNPRLSLSFYLALFALKLKGIKTIFSEDPINYKKLRKEDTLKPSARFLKPLETRFFSVLKSKITEMHSKSPNKKLVIFLPGGAFISGPLQHHWDTLKLLINKTNCTTWLCDYPKSPEHQIEEISNNIDEVYQTALKDYSPEQIILIGDSAGATLILGLTQRLIQQNLKPPHKLILISPVLDSAKSNKDIEELDKKDVILSRKGVLSSMRMCAGELALENVMMSPIKGSFKGFPKTILFIAENDICAPDQRQAIEKFEDNGVDLEVVEGKQMPHNWPILPIIKEARPAKEKIIWEVNN